MKARTAGAAALWLALAAAGVPAFAGRVPPSPSTSVGGDVCAPLRAAADRVIRPWVVRSERGPARKAVGVAVGLHIAGRECYFGYGTTRFGSGTVPTRRTLFEIGSVTKTFTATMLALRQVRNPAFSARSPVNTSGIPCAGNVCLKLDNGMQDLTYRELATFTGGLPDDPTNLAGIGMRHYTQADFIAYLDGLAAPRGGLPAANRYSNSGYGFLGQLLMALDGYRDFDDPDAFRASFDRWIGKAITGPLAMTCTAADIESLQPACDAASEMATGYRYEKGRYVKVRLPWPWVPWGPAGALRSDTEDLVHYVGAYLGVAEVGGVRVPADLGRAMALAIAPTEIPLSNGNSADRQAYAWIVVGSSPANAFVLKDGGTTGFSSCIAMMPERGAGAVVLANSGRANACGKARRLLRLATAGGSNASGRK